MRLQEIELEDLVRQANKIDNIKIKNKLPKALTFGNFCYIINMVDER